MKMHEEHRKFWFGVAVIVVGWIVIELVLKPVAAHAAAPTTISCNDPQADPVMCRLLRTKAGGATGAWLL